MRYGPEHRAKSHEQIVRNASRELRAKGLNGPGVAALMKASGLTVGGFYKHFRSREDLLVEAIEESLADFDRHLIHIMMQAHHPEERWKELVRWYLSADHCGRADRGCPIAALAPEIARCAPPLKKRIEGLMKASRERLMEFMPGRSEAEKERSFFIIFATMAGAISMARLMSSPAAQQKVLNSVRDHLLKSF